MVEQMSFVKNLPPVKTTNFHFELHCKLKIFESNPKSINGNCNLLAVSQYYGLIFVGNLYGFTVIRTKISTSTYSGYPNRNIILNFKPTQLSVDHSQNILAVACNSSYGALLYLYEIASFARKEQNVTPIKVTVLSKIVQNLATAVIDMMWQPNLNNSLLLCMSNGSVILLTQCVKDGSVYTLPNTTLAMCLCWSPNGQQLVIGKGNGVLSQYKPDLKLVKSLPVPPLYGGALSVISVLWISTYQFAAAYSNRNCTYLFPVIVIINANENEPVTFLNFEDITYSSILFRPHQIYMTYQKAWNLIFVSSANGTELAVLHSKKNSKWEQWLLGNASRAELPLNAANQNTFPIGVALDFTTTDSIIWEGLKLPPMPRLLILTDEGVLCIFNVINTVANVPQLCSPPKEDFDESLFPITSTLLPLWKQDKLPSEVTGFDNKIYRETLRDEINHFNSELELVLSEIGSDKDKVNLKKVVDDLLHFWKELKYMSPNQTSESHSAVIDLPEPSAYSRDVQEKNLRKSEELNLIKNSRSFDEMEPYKNFIELQFKQIASSLNLSGYNGYKTISAFSGNNGATPDGIQYNPQKCPTRFKIMLGTSLILIFSFFLFFLILFNFRFKEYSKA